MWKLIVVVVLVGLAAAGCRSTRVVTLDVHVATVTPVVTETHVALRIENAPQIAQEAQGGPQTAERERP